jgi:extracellular factor (EF) 3-hydroxypalmitic acid methyl ester biosynthesis protein
VEIRGNLLRLTRHLVVLEICNPGSVLQTSEVLSEFKIIWNDRTLYSGRAVVRNFVNTSLVTVCEVSLENSWVDVDFSLSTTTADTLRGQFEGFVQEWQKLYRVAPEFKALLADLQTFLTDLRLWLEQVELGIRSSPSADRAELEQQISQTLAQPILFHIDAMHERFEEAARQIPTDQRDAHQVLVRRQLHPLFLCAPFAYRTYQKPLGYAGDYEIMNMIHRNTFEGASLYAKMIHFWLVRQWAAQSVRNRIVHMKARLIEETLRVMRERRPARILNLGCGPAREVQDFIAERAFSDYAEFTLVDFDAETLAHVASALGKAKRDHGRTTGVHLSRMSVNQLLRFSTRPSSNPLGSGFDMIYCGGLFDYLSDRICKRLVSMFYDLVTPGGLVVVANMHDERRPFRYMVEFLLDWHLIYRDAACMSSFVPEAAAPDSWSVVHEPTAANMFLEVRKPLEP